MKTRSICCCLLVVTLCFAASSQAGTYYIYGGTYANTYMSTGWSTSTAPGNDPRYDSPYNTLTASNATSRINILKYEKQVLQHLATTSARMTTLYNNTWALKARTDNLDAELTNIASTLNAKNQIGISRANGVSLDYQGRSHKTVSAWQNITYPQVLSNQEIASSQILDRNPAGNVFDTRQTARSWIALARTQEEYSGALNGMDLEVCANERGALGYWQGDVFVRTNPEHPQCRAGNCVCEKLF